MGETPRKRREDGDIDVFILKDDYSRRAGEISPVVT